MSTFKYYMLLNIEQHERLVRVAWLVTINIDPHQESLKSVQSQCAEPVPFIGRKAWFDNLYDYI